MIKKFGINKDIGNIDVVVYLTHVNAKLEYYVIHIDDRMTDIKRAKKLVKSLQKAIEYVESSIRETSKGANT